MLAVSIFTPLRGEFGADTALLLSLVGASCGAIGVWVVQFGRAFITESLAHGVLPGLVAASLAGASLIAGAAAGIAVAYIVFQTAERAPRTAPASATSVAVTALVAAGALLATAGSNTLRLESLLFGDPLAATRSDIAFALTLAVGIVVALAVVHSRFSALAFDSGTATALGVRPSRVTAVLVLILMLAVTVAANVAGSLLALALVTGPALASLALSRRIGRSIAVAAVLGMTSGIAGIYISYYADWPLAPSVALVASLAPVAAGLARPLLRPMARESAAPDPAGP